MGSNLIEKLGSPISETKLHRLNDAIININERMVSCLLF